MRASLDDRSSGGLRASRKGGLLEWEVIQEKKGSYTESLEKPGNMIQVLNARNKWQELETTEQEKLLIQAAYYRAREQSLWS